MHTDAALLKAAKQRPAPVPVMGAGTKLALGVMGTPLRRGLAALLLFVILAGMGWWTYAGVRDSLRELRAGSLQTVLDAESKALEIWIDEKKSDAGRWAADPAVRTAVEGLMQLRAQGAVSQALCTSTFRRILLDRLRPFLKEEGSVAVNVIDRDGFIVTSEFDAYCGLHVQTDTFMRHISDVFAGSSKFVRPYSERDRLAEARRFMFERPVAWVKAPVRDAGGRVVAVLGFGKFADDHFGRILAVARPGRTGEAYAFDENGVMLSESRFVAVMRASGLIGPTESAMLRVQVRDPGGDLQAGHVPASSVERPLTRLAYQAIASRGAAEPAARRGVLLDPYRNYRGAEVIGAWKWLPEYEMGIAFEVGVEEAYAPLRYLDITFVALFGLLVLAMAAAYFSSLSVVRLRRQAEHRVGPYTIEKAIAEGGMSNIYRARHALLKRPVAVKILKKHMATDESIARFEREVQLASRLTHPNTIEIYDYGPTGDGGFYYAMEYLEGESLAELVGREGPLPLARAVHLLRQVCASLAEAHAQGLVHRDIKPHNIMLCRIGGTDDVVKVLDFGLVKNIANPDERDLTQHMRILGTPLYMAPERIRNPADADARADLYALGAVAFFIITGCKLFESGSDHDLTNQILNAVPRRVSTLVAVPPELDELISACVAKERNARPQDVAAVLAVLDRLALVLPWNPAVAPAPV